MTEKTPRQLMREALEKNAQEVAQWPSWMRNAISTADVFRVPTVGSLAARPETTALRSSADPGEPGDMPDPRRP